MKITEDQRKALREPIEAKYLKPHPTMNYLTVIHPMAVVERLNNVFGIGSWRTHLKSGRVAGENGRFTATCKLILEVPEYAIHLEQFGGSTNGDSGDALKGAATDALTKCASYLEIGFEIYSGETNRNGGTSSTAGASKPASDKQRGLIRKLMQEVTLTPQEQARLDEGLADATWSSKSASAAIEHLNGKK